LFCDGLSGVAGCAKPVLGPIRAPFQGAVPVTSDAWAWARCLRLNVRDGLVDYVRLAAQPEDLNAVLADLASSPEPNDGGLVRTARWINAYNALAMRAGLEQYLAGGGNMARTRAPREDEYRFRCPGKDVTLADIRRQLLDDPACDARVLFALCRASVGVTLHDQPFQPDLVDRQLSAVAAKAMNNPDVVRVDHENKILWIAHEIGRHQTLLIRWFERRTGARGAHLLDALLDVADDTGRRRLNAAVGYPVGVRPADVRLNIYGARQP